jgi:hypothetical protein
MIVVKADMRDGAFQRRQISVRTSDLASSGRGPVPPHGVWEMVAKTAVTRRD